jgi:hypothetical protein
MKQVLLVVLARSHARTLARSLTPALTTEFLFRILPLGFSDASCTLQYCTVRRAIQAHPLPPLRLTRSRLLVLEPAAFFFLSFQRKEDIDTLLHIASSATFHRQSLHIHARPRGERRRNGVWRGVACGRRRKKRGGIVTADRHGGRSSQLLDGWE